jgi:hypothetical protein
MRPVRLGIRAGEWPLILLIAVAVAVPTAFAPLLAVAAAAVLIVLGFVVFNAGALLLLMVAAFPWDDMLGFPTETISMIKLLGALLLVGYFLRSATLPVPPTSPYMRDHQRWQGEVCWHWLAERRRWT